MKQSRAKSRFMKLQKPSTLNIKQTKSSQVGHVLVLLVYFGTGLWSFEENFGEMWGLQTHDSVSNLPFKVARYSFQEIQEYNLLRT